MKQSRSMSMLETGISTAVGFAISLLAQWVFLPLVFGVAVHLEQNVAFALIMTVVSLLRQYGLRRLFEALHIRTPLSPFLLAVIAERRRQVTGEGWSTEHDDAHEPGELATAGAAYAKMARAHLGRSASGGDDAFRRWTLPNWWPWTADWWKPTDFRRDLVKGAALIVAEGEKFDRNRKPARPA